MPTTALAAAKTRRKGRRSGGGDDEIPDEGDGGGFGGPPGGGDGDEWARWWWGGDDNGEPEGGPPRSLLQVCVRVRARVCVLRGVGWGGERLLQPTASPAPPVLRISPPKPSLQGLQCAPSTACAFWGAHLPAAPPTSRPNPCFSSACLPACLQDVLFLWSVFCAISFVQTLQHVMRRGAPRGPPGVLAALSLQHLLPRGSAAAATVR